MRSCMADDVVPIIIAAFVALAINFTLSSVISQITAALAPNSTAVEVLLFLLMNILLILSSFAICFNHVKKHRG